MAYGGGAMSARRLKLAWGALLGASAFSAVALVAVPRRGPLAPEPLVAPETRPSDALAIASDPLGDSPEQSEVDEPLTVDAEAMRAEPVAVGRASRRSPASVTSVPDARGALSSLLEGARGLTSATLADTAVGLGPDLVPSLLDGLLGRGEWPEGEDAATGDLRVAALRDAWSRYEPALRAQALVEFSAPTRDERRVLVELAGELGGELALPTVVRIARGFEPSELSRSFVAEPVEQALALALRASTLSERNLESMLADLSAELAATLVRGWAHSGDSRGPAIAARALGIDAALDLEILTALAQPTCPARAALGERALALVRQALQRDDPRLRRCAAAALGNARDTLAVEALVESLDDVDALVRASARDALRSVTGSDLGGDSAAWGAWLGERREWLEGTLPRDLARARGADCVDAMEALESLLARRDACDHVVEGVGVLHLEAECEPVRERARTALLELGSARSLSLARREGD